MSKDAFWALIQEAKTACGQDLNAMEDYLREQLVSMGPAAAKNFHNILQTYEDLADQYGLWDAVSVIKEYGCSDDGFIDFRAWQCLSYVGDYAYEQLTGRSAYDEMEPDRIEKMRDELKKDIVYKDGIQYPREPKDLPRFLPRLCEKYGGPERFLAAPSTWNYDLHEIRRLLDEGKVQDMATKKEKGGGAR